MSETMYGGSEIKLPKSIQDAQTSITVPEPTPIQIESEVTSTGRKVWDAPILDRGKLREHLNTLEGAGYNIFQILPLDRASVQVVCYINVPDKPIDEEHE